MDAAGTLPVRSSAADNESVHDTDDPKVSALENSIRPDGQQFLIDYYNNSDTFIQQLVLNQATSSSPNNTKSLIDKVITQAFEKGVRSSSRAKKVTVSASLTSGQTSVMNVSFPQYSINFANENTNSHGFAAAHRVLERQVLFDKIGYNPKKYYPQTDYNVDVFVCDIGGHFANNIIQSCESMHTCAPVLDLTDANRFTNRATTMDTHIANNACFSETKRKQIDDYNKVCADRQLVTKTLCFRKSQDCHIRAKIGIALHSIYDMTLHDIADTMEKKNMNSIFGTFIYVDEVLLKSTGIIKNLDCKWIVNKEKQTISFFFKNDSAYPYTHSLPNYLKLVSVPFFYSRDKKNVFFIELQENINGVQFFRINRQLLTPQNSSTIHHIIPFPSLQDKYRINFMLYDKELVNQFVTTIASIFQDDHIETTTTVEASRSYCDDKVTTKYRNLFDVDDIQVVNFSSGIIAVSFYAPVELVEAMLAFAFASSETKFKPSELYNFARSHCGKIFVNKQVIHRCEPPSAVKLFNLAYAVYVYVYDSKFKSGKCLEAVLKDIKSNRELADKSVWQKLFSEVVPSMLSISGTGIFAKFDAYLYENLKAPTNTNAIITHAESCRDVEFRPRSYAGQDLKFSVSIPEGSKIFFEEYYDHAMKTILSEAYAVPFTNLTNNTVDISKAEARGFADSDLPISADVDYVPGTNALLDFAVNEYQQFIRDDSDANDLRDRLSRITSLLSDSATLYVLIPFGLDRDVQYEVYQRLKSRFKFVAITRRRVSYYYACRVRGSSAPLDTKSFHAIMDEYVDQHLSDNITSDNKVCLNRFNTIDEILVPISFQHYTVPQINIQSKPADVVRRPYYDVLRDRLSLFTNHQIDEAVSRLNDPLPKGVHNRSHAKLERLFHCTNLETGTGKFLDICSAPGGFTKFLVETKKMVGFSVSGTDASCVRTTYYPFNAEGLDEAATSFSIFSDSEVNLMVHKLNGEEITLVVADGAVDASTDFNQQEQLNAPMLCRQVAMALRVLKRGGSFVVKVFGLDCTVTREIMFLLLLNFELLEIVKPHYSKPSNSEFYVVCHRYKQVFMHSALTNYSCDDSTVLGFKPTMTYNAFQRHLENLSNKFVTRHMTGLRKLIVQLESDHPPSSLMFTANAPQFDDAYLPDLNALFYQGVRYDINLLNDFGFNNLPQICVTPPDEESLSGTYVSAADSSFLNDDISLHLDLIGDMSAEIMELAGITLTSEAPERVSSKVIKPIHDDYVTIDIDGEWVRFERTPSSTRLENRHFTVLVTQGDGYCLWHAATLGLVSLQRLRDLATNIHNFRSVADARALNEFIEKGWGGIPILEILSRYMNVRYIVFQMTETNVPQVLSIGESGPVFYLYYKSMHYSAIVPLCGDCRSKITDFRLPYTDMDLIAFVHDAALNFSQSSYACLGCNIAYHPRRYISFCETLIEGHHSVLQSPRNYGVCVATEMLLAPAPGFDDEFVLPSLATCVDHEFMDLPTSVQGPTKSSVVPDDDISISSSVVERLDRASFVPRVDACSVSDFTSSSASLFSSVSTHKDGSKKIVMEDDTPVHDHPIDSGRTTTTNSKILRSTDLNPKAHEFSPKKDLIVSVSVNQPDDHCWESAGRLHLVADVDTDGTVLNEQELLVWFNNVLNKFNRMGTPITKIDLQLPNFVAFGVLLDRMNLDGVEIRHIDTGDFPIKNHICYVENDARDTMLNAMNEIRFVWGRTTKETIAQLTSFYERIDAFMNETTLCTDNSVGIIDVKERKWILKPNADLNDAECGLIWDGKNYRLEQIRGLVIENNVISNHRCAYPFVVVSKSTKVMNEDRMLTVVKSKVLRKRDLDFSVKTVEGVPGAGKTAYIVENHDRSMNLNHVVFTATRESALQIRDRTVAIMQQKNLTPTQKTLLKKKYSTMDRALINIRDYTNVNTIYVDEGLMRHSGQIYWLAYLLKAKHLIVCGDSCQIGYFNSEGITTSYERINKDFITDTEYLNNSYRIPADAAFFLNDTKAYKNVICTYNNTIRSMNSTEIASLNDVNIVDLPPKKTQLLTFSQAEKAELKKSTTFSRYKVNTVGEFQGKQSENVILIRTNNKQSSLHDNVNQHVVAISRHTKYFHYYTIRNDDLHCKINAIREMSTAELTKFQKNILRGGGFVYNSAYSSYSKYFPRLAEFEQSPDFEVTLKPPYASNLNFESKILAELVLNHGDSGYVSYKPKFTPIPVLVVPDTEPIVPSKIENSMVLIQDMIDTVFPGSSLKSSRYDYEIFEHDPLYLTCDDFSISPILCPKPPIDTLTPLLRTSCPAAFPQTQRQTLKAFNERNGGVPELAGRINADILADKMFDKFKQTYVADQQLYETFANHPISINIDTITEWLRTQSPNVLDHLRGEPEYSIYFKDLTNYMYMLKRMAKPSLDPHPENSNPSPQAIAFQEKLINAIFCPLVREIKHRFLAVLRKDKILNCDMSPVEFENIINHRFPPQKLKEFVHTIELDFSKYDKSQALTALLFETKVMSALGIPKEFTDLWQYMHVDTTLTSLSNKFRARVAYQRKSGDAMTYFGNTLYLMAVLAYVLPLKTSFCLFSGDDSYVFAKRPIDANKVINSCALTFNLEVKLLKYDVPYFCSKFLLPTSDDKWTVVPDPLKVAIKLGRSDLVNFAHRELYRISMTDIVLPFGDERIYEVLGRAIANRYKTDVLPMWFAALYWFINDKTQFNAAYYLRGGDVLGEYTMLPSLDI
jgi:23S rRNA U2552 (ribose-2'-O)-methylase RlmE/FtsJ